MRAFRAQADGCGALASFTGIARPLGHGGGAVTAMFLDHHPRLTLQSMEQIRAQAVSRFALVDARIIHRCGPILPSEPIVWVAASAPHRRAVLDAVDCMMDRLKTEAIFWKREETALGAHWIEPTEADHAAAERWA